MKRTVTHSFIFILCLSIVNSSLGGESLRKPVQQNATPQDATNAIRKSTTLTYERVEHVLETPHPKRMSLAKLVEMVGVPPQVTNLDVHESGSVCWNVHYVDSFENDLYTSFDASFLAGELMSFSHSDQRWLNGGKNYNNRIQVDGSELALRSGLATNALSLGDVSKVLGGKPFTGYINEKGNGKAFWRFVLTDAKDKYEEFAICQGEFVDNKLVWFHRLPST